MGCSELGHVLPSLVGQLALSGQVVPQKVCVAYLGMSLPNLVRKCLQNHISRATHWLCHFWIITVLTPASKLLDGNGSHDEWCRQAQLSGVLCQKI